MTRNATVINVLIADDDDGHATLIQEHLEDSGIDNPITRFRDGAEAWAFLSGEAGDAGQPVLNPDQAYLLLLDIRMPRMDGVEVLRRIKAHPTLHAMPVIMLVAMLWMVRKAAVAMPAGIPKAGLLKSASPKMAAGSMSIQSRSTRA